MKALKIAGWILGGIVLLFGSVAAYAYFKYFNVEGDFVADFIQKNPSKASLVLVRNDSILVSRDADRKMPLASTVKIIIAIEYAKQVAGGKIDPEELVPLTELSRFYIPKTDGGAHPEWIRKSREKDLIRSGKIAMAEVAKGMIRYSSNANTEYLMWRLGLNKINANLAELGLTHHDSLYPFASALYVCSDENSAKGLSLMPRTMYINRAYDYFELLKADTTVKQKFVFAHLSLPAQRVWSDRLPASTAREYAGLMKKIQSRTYFNSKTQTVLEGILEWPMEAFDSNRKQFEHLGAKGGSTAFVLTYALYATDKKGNQTQLVFMFNELTPFESNFLQANLSNLQLKILSGTPSERKELIRTLTRPVAN